MAHRVDFTVPPRKVGRADVEFHVKRDGVKLGTLAVSSGSVVWFQRNHSWGFKMSWRYFDRIMAENGIRWEHR